MDANRPIVALHNDKVAGRPSPSEAKAYRSLLESAGLPPDGLQEFLASALIAVDDGEVVGGVALEPYGDAALLRSLVVAPDRRGTGLGGRLVAAIVKRADELGVRRIFLLTETAGDFFARRGFVGVDRGSVPAAVQESVQFRSACPKSAAVLTAEVRALQSQPRKEN